MLPVWFLAHRPDRPRRFRRITICAVAALLYAAPQNASAAGLLLADGGFGGRLEIEEHRVEVTLNNGIAVTDVTQVFRNLEDRQVEALYTFPVPKGASVSNFSMWIDGKEMVGEVVEKERAREIYNSYKAQRIDPGLLEQVDYKAFEMRIFPIPPRGEQRVQVTYYQELDHDHDWVTWVYPLATNTRQDVDSRTRGTFSLSVDIRSEVPLQIVESPSHRKDFVFARHSENYVQASLETQEGDLNRDLVLAYELSRPRTGIDLITSRETGEDGFFCLILTVGEDLSRLDIGMDYVFVLDISGSMRHASKLDVSQGSVQAFIDALGEDDRFEVITFNVQPSTLFDSLQAVTAESRRRAADFLSGQRARGGTSLNPAVKTAYRYGDPDRQLNVVILSDGMTEEKKRPDLVRLLRGRPENTRVFCVGVGNEVNRPLLEQVAATAGGIAAFVSHGDDFDRQAQAFRRKLVRPAATDVALSFSGDNVYDLEPEQLPDLFHGTPLRVYGRYRKAGEIPLAVTADVAGREFRQTFPLSLPETETLNPEIERMWASKRMDRLLKDADANGDRQSVLAEIVRLGEEYSITSEYTSFLVLENDNEYKRWRIERRNLRRTARDRKSRQQLARRLTEIREKAVTELGPAAAREAKKETAFAPTPVPGNTVRTTDRTSDRTSATPQGRRQVPRPDREDREDRRNRTGRSFDFGVGPVGPLFVGYAAWLTRRRRKRRSDPAAPAL